METVVFSFLFRINIVTAIFSLYLNLPVCVGSHKL